MKKIVVKVACEQPFTSHSKLRITFNKVTYCLQFTILTGTLTTTTGVGQPAFAGTPYRCGTTGRKLLEFLNRCGTTGCSALKSLILIGCFALKSSILKGCIKIYDFKAPAKAS